MNKFFTSSMLWLAVLVMAGCVATDFPRQAPSEDGLASYQSELSEPNAKALYAFTEFRMLAGEQRWDEALAALERAHSFDSDSDYLLLLLTRAYLHLEKIEEAKAVLDRLLIRSPHNVTGLELRGDIASMEKDYPTAVENYRSIVALTSQNHKIGLKLAMVLSRIDRTDEAIKVLEGFLKEYPEENVLRLALARFYLNQNRTEQARAAYQKILETEPRQQHAILELGKLFEQQDPEKALTLYLDVLSRYPEAAAVRQQLVQFFLAHGEKEKALGQLQELRWQYPENMQIGSQIGLLQLELENWKLAEKEFGSLVNKGRQQDKNLYYLSMALAGQEKIDAAVRQLEKIAPDSSIYAVSRLQLAYLYNKSQQEERALSVLKRAISDGFGSPEIYYYLVAYLGDAEKQDEALEYARAATVSYPEDTKLLYQLGVLLERLGERDSAVRTMEQILALDPDHSDALNFLAYHQAENEIDLELALTRAKRALELKKSGYIIDTLGWVYYKMGRYQESRVHLEEAARLHPEDHVILQHLGDLYRAMNLMDKAAETYRRVLEIAPDEQETAKKLKDLDGESF